MCECACASASPCDVSVLVNDPESLSASRQNSLAEWTVWVHVYVCVRCASVHVLQPHPVTSLCLSMILNRCRPRARARSVDSPTCSSVSFFMENSSAVQPIDDNPMVLSGAALKKNTRTHTSCQDNSMLIFFGLCRPTVTLLASRSRSSK